MTDSDLDKDAVRQAALALRAAIARFEPGDSAVAKMVLGFVSNALPIDDAIHGRIEAPIDRQPNAEKGLDGALQGYPELGGPYYEFSSQLYGIASVKRQQEIIRQMAASRESSMQPK